MGNSEEGKPSTSEKPSLLAVDQTNFHVYPDWAAMQAYYRPRVALPSYYNSAVTSGHPAHPYMWAPPQAMIPHYGAPYAAVYSHGAVYAHPTVPIGSHSGCHEVPTNSSASESLAAMQRGKTSGNLDQGLMKKLKGFDGLAMSIGNGNCDSGDRSADCTRSQSGETEGSSNGYDGRATKVLPSTIGRCREVTRVTGGGKTDAQGGRDPDTEVTAHSDRELDVATVLTGGAGKVGAVVSVSTALLSDPRDSTNLNAQNSPNIVPPASAVLPSEAWLQTERDLRRERRKQSNRESARRSRLRKQAETEDLAMRVETLGAENAALKAEIGRLTEHSDKLRFQNTQLLEKLSTRGDSSMAAANWRSHVSQGSLFLRVENSGCAEKNHGSDDEDPNPGTKLHQLLDASPRADAVVAG